MDHLFHPLYRDPVDDRGIKSIDRQEADLSLNKVFQEIGSTDKVPQGWIPVCRYSEGGPVPAPNYPVTKYSGYVQLHH